MAKLTELVKEGRAYIQIEDGCRTSELDLDKQIEAMGLGDFDIRYALEEPQKKLHIRVYPSKCSPGYEEAEFTVQEEKSGEQVKVPSTIPGFLLARNEQETTLNEIINRAVKFAGEKYLPDLFEVPFRHEMYKITKYRIQNVKQKEGKLLAEIEMEIQKEEKASYNSLHEYWRTLLVPILNHEKLSPAAKKITLVEFLRDLTNNYKAQAGDPNLKKIQNIIHATNHVLDKQIDEAETKYTKLCSEIETTDKKIANAHEVYAKGLLEKIAKNTTLRKMHDHENALKFFKREPFKIRTARTEIKLVP
jgi:hypothetical protein